MDGYDDSMSLNLGEAWVKCDGCLALANCDKRGRCRRYDQWKQYQK